MRDDFSEEVKRKLAGRAGHFCSNLNCRQPTSGPSEAAKAVTNVGVAAHITAASACGPRYDPSLTQEQRSDLDNGVWLCQNCAKRVDNDVARFPEALLRAWKTDAEHRARNSVGRTAPERAESESERKARGIRPWTGKSITLRQMTTGGAVMRLGRDRGSLQAQVLDCTEFFVKIGQTGQDGWSRSIPLTNIEISFDDSRKCLELQERYD